MKCLVTTANSEWNFNYCTFFPSKVIISISNHCYNSHFIKKVHNDKISKNTLQVKILKTASNKKVFCWLVAYCNPQVLISITVFLTTCITPESILCQWQYSQGHVTVLPIWLKKMDTPIHIHYIITTWSRHIFLCAQVRRSLS